MWPCSFLVPLWLPRSHSPTLPRTSRSHVAALTLALCARRGTRQVLPHPPVAGEYQQRSTDHRNHLCPKFSLAELPLPNPHHSPYPNIQGGPVENFTSPDLSFHCPLPFFIRALDSSSRSLRTRSPYHLPSVVFILILPSRPLCTVRPEEFFFSFDLLSLISPPRLLSTRLIIPRSPFFSPARRLFFSCSTTISVLCCDRNLIRVRVPLALPSLLSTPGATFLFAFVPRRKFSHF